MWHEHTVCDGVIEPIPAGGKSALKNFAAASIRRVGSSLPALGLKLTTLFNLTSPFFISFTFLGVRFMALQVLLFFLYFNLFLTYW